MSSVMDDLKRLEDRILARIRELEANVAELEQLREVAARLGILDGDRARQPSATRPARATTRRRRRVRAEATVTDARPGGARTATSATWTVDATRTRARGGRGRAGHQRARDRRPARGQPNLAVPGGPATDERRVAAQGRPRTLARLALNGARRCAVAVGVAACSMIVPTTAGAVGWGINLDGSVAGNPPAFSYQSNPYFTQLLGGTACAGLVRHAVDLLRPDLRAVGRGQRREGELRGRHVRAVAVRAGDSGRRLRPGAERGGARWSAWATCSSR